MLIPRIFTGRAWMMVAAGALVMTTTGLAADNADNLARAIKLFDQGEYLAAHEVLADLDRDDLSPADRIRRDDYLNKVEVAINMEDKALRDLEDAEIAEQEGDRSRARRLLQAVVDNPYASASMRKLAEVKMGKTGTQPDRQIRQAADRFAQAQGGNASDRARALTAEGDSFFRAGRYDDAESAYQKALQQIPGYPDAVAGLNRVRRFREQNISAPQRSLADEIRREDAISWQRTVTQYRDAERAILQEVNAQRFDEAREILVRARQIVEAGKQYAEPISKYENLASELEALEAHVENVERQYHEQELEDIRITNEQERRQRIERVREQRAMEVEQLMAQAMQLRKDQEFEKAINVLRQIIAIDPKFMPARWMLDEWEEAYQYRRQRELRETFYRKSQEALLDVEDAKIPWWKEINYPDEWPELIQRETRQIPGQTTRDSLLLGALNESIDVNFPNTPFREAVEQLAVSQNVNIIVNWHDLQTAGVKPDAPIDLRLPNQVTLRKALTEILSQAGGGRAELGFEVADNAISVSTRQKLDSRTHNAIYPISDLLMDIPTYNGAPVPDLRSTMANANQQGRKNTLDWQYGEDKEDDWDRDPSVQAKIDHLIELIKESVAPESWRDRGGTIGSIEEINQQLVITQNSANQREIGGLLDKLREQRAIQISVEAIFLTVSSHYLEELGMDLDIILNSGNAGYDFLDEGGFAAQDQVLGNRLLLPRTYSRLGFTPATPGLGTATVTSPAAGINQPFQQPFLVPQGGGGGGSQLTPVPVLSSVTDFTDPSGLPSDIPGSFAGQTIGPALSILGSFLDNIQVDFLIRATQADSRTTVLTAPRLVVFNGGSAWVAVTIQQNFVSQLNPVVAQGAVAQAPVTQVIDAGASLFVRGTVTTDRRYVMLLLAPGITRLLDLQNFPFSGGTGALAAFVQLPTLSAQRLQTMVSVPDGGTLLIGGQKLASETEVEAGVPILSKIPVLKRAYSARTSVKDEQTLLILIKPKILIHSEQEELAFPNLN